MGRGLSQVQQQVLLLAHAARRLRASDLAHPELMSALFGWPDPASPTLDGYEVAHASMARTLARLEARGLLLRLQGESVVIRLTERGVLDAQLVLDGLGALNREHAVHEAGHAVVALGLGLRLGVVHVVPGFGRDELEGGGVKAFSMAGDKRQAARLDIAVAWGGACAERVVLGADIQERTEHGSAETDFKDIQRLARRFRISGRDVDGLREHAERIVCGKKAPVLRLVAALCSFGIIGGRDAQAIFDGRSK